MAGLADTHIETRHCQFIYSSAYNKMNSREKEGTERIRRSIVNLLKHNGSMGCPSIGKPAISGWICRSYSQFDRIHERGIRRRGFGKAAGNSYTQTGHELPRQNVVWVF